MTRSSTSGPGAPPCGSSTGSTPSCAGPPSACMVATNRTGRSVLILAGPEPDMRWHAFIVGGRPAGLSAGGGAGDRVGRLPGSRAAHPTRPPGRDLDGGRPGRQGRFPARQYRRAVGGTGGSGVCLRRGQDPGGRPVGPGPPLRGGHALSGRRLRRLLDGLARLAELEIDTSTLHAAAAATHQQIEQLIAQSDEHAGAGPPAGGPSRIGRKAWPPRPSTTCRPATSWLRSWSGSCAARADSARPAAHLVRRHETPPGRLSVVVPASVVTGDNDQRMTVADQGRRKRIAFYAPTPAVPVLEGHGWASYNPNSLSCRSRAAGTKWERPSAIKSLDAFGEKGTPEQFPEFVAAASG